MKVEIYLRKSRADEEKEKYFGQGETLHIHRKELLSLAKAKKFDVIKILEEVVSGESLLNRPAMLELLKDVESGQCDAVLVMDIQRLGRGDMEEQGLILKTFKKANVKIITPDKIYDLNNEFDEEYSEFEAFMSRKEYKMINKRLQRGVIHSVKEGNYNGAYAPYGYDIQQDKTGRTLVPNPQQAEIVRMIFNWYANENIGSQIISDRLNKMEIKTNKGNKWTSQSVAYIIKNPLYIGKITWKKCYGYYSTKKKKANKKRPVEEWIIVDGKHDPIVDVETFNKANEYMKKHIKSPVKPKTSLNNPLAGLVVCGVCGGKMRYRTYSKSEPHLICINKCGNKSSKFKYIEASMLNELKNILNKYIVETRQDISAENIYTIETLKGNIASLEKELTELLKQKDNLHDLLERGIYTPEVFLERSKAVACKIEAAQSAINSTKAQLEVEFEKDNKANEIIPKITEVISTYHLLKTADEKNSLLKEIVSSIEYRKDKNQRNDDFEIRVNTRF